MAVIVIILKWTFCKDKKQTLCFCTGHTLNLLVNTPFIFVTSGSTQIIQGLLRLIVKKHS